MNSKNVTYDNTSSTLVSTNVQDALDELYGKLSIASQVISDLYITAIKETVTTAGEEIITQASSVGLMKDSFGNIRYYGASPNNYVSFNGELWRIIGVFEVEDENGNTESRIKLIRNESIDPFSYDSKPSGTGTSTSDDGSNDWTDARLMMLLNPGYETASDLYAYEGSLYWNRRSGTCYDKISEGTKSCDFTSKGLSSSAQAMIGQAKYYLGGSSVHTGLYADDYYTFERGTTVPSGHATTWTGYIGVMYPSDYAYAADLSSCRLAGFINTGYDYSPCTSVNWLYNGKDQWTLNPYATDSTGASRVDSSGFVYWFYPVYNALSVRPVVYLKSSITITGGDGSSSNPYTLG